MSALNPLSLAVIGAGAWGKNLVRVLHRMPEVDLRLVVDRAADARARVADMGLCTAAEPEAAFRDSSIAAVALATPAPTHAVLTLEALAAGKHVFVEKPLCLSLAEGERIRRAAAETNKTVMVGHLLVYHPAVDKLRALAHTGALGTIHYLYATRVNLGVVRPNETAWWSLAPHDIAIILTLLKEEPVRVAAYGSCHLTPGVEDVVVAHLDFASGVTATIHVSWLDPRKARQLTVVGTQKMVTFDDMEPAEKVRVYDLDTKATKDVDSKASSIAVRRGDAQIPRLLPAEPLQVELHHFVWSVLQGTPPRTGVGEGLAVVRVLEAGQRSLALGGAKVALREGG